jgi:hypothetical protein
LGKRTSAVTRPRHLPARFVTPLLGFRFLINRALKSAVSVHAVTGACRTFHDVSGRSMTNSGGSTMHYLGTCANGRLLEVRAAGIDTKPLFHWLSICQPAIPLLRTRPTSRDRALILRN